MSQNKIKLLALDLDGTALRSDNTLSDGVRKAVEAAIAEGIEVVVASGRPFGSMHGSVLEIEGINYIIASNGAAVYDGSRSRLFSRLLKEADVTELLRLTEGEDMIFEGFVDGLTYADKRYTDDPVKYGCTPAYVDYVRAAHGKLEDMRGFLYLNKARLDSVECIVPDSLEFRRVWDLIENGISGIRVTSSSKSFIELMDRSAAKAEALKWICSKEGIDRANVCACGNAPNDADMIRWAGLGAAVANACEECRELADMTVPENDRDGVARLIDIILRL